jgi:hypothetical protein
MQLAAVEARDRPFDHALGAQAKLGDPRENLRL